MYVPHGIDEDTFFPIQEGHKDFEALQEFKSNLFKGKEIEYVVFFNSRNIQRKHPGDTILAFKQFCDIIGEEKAKKVALVMKTEVSSQHGTDLRAIKETFCPELNVMFATEKLSPAQMNLLYNISDLTVLLSSNEGWGLALTESMMAGTMISANVTGGMQDQMRFENEKGEWIDFDADFPSNHRGTYKKHGEWAIPIWPTNMSMMGSPLTPYIYDDRCMPEDAAKTMLQAYELGREERNKKGLKGREWARSKEAGFTGKMMSNNIIKGIDETIDNFEPRPLYEIKKIENYSQDRITHKLTGY
jgi:glycosyltransferase involved in cell wall biosynthesis